MRSARCSTSNRRELMGCRYALLVVSLVAYVGTAAWFLKEPSVDRVCLVAFYTSCLVVTVWPKLLDPVWDAFLGE